eukprot:8286821-Alexandrium_andersonii.AAC.1
MYSLPACFAVAAKEHAQAVHQGQGDKHAAIRDDPSAATGRQARCAQASGDCRKPQTRMRRRKITDVPAGQTRNRECDLARA